MDADPALLPPPASFPIPLLSSTAKKISFLIEPPE